MAFLENIRKQPREKRIRLIWISSIIAGLLLLILWVATAGIHKDIPKDTSLFDTAGRGVNDLTPKL